MHRHPSASVSGVRDRPVLKGNRPALPLDPVLSPHQDKIITANAAAKMIGAGRHVFIGTACASPPQRWSRARVLIQIKPTSLRILQSAARVSGSGEV